MKAILVIDLGEEHLFKQTNDLYDRLKGYKVKLKPLPEKLLPGEGKTIYKPSMEEEFEWGWRGGWNACLKEIEDDVK